MEVIMKAYKGKFKKKDGSERTMVFTRIDMDLEMARKIHRQ